jgi:hypothetical protein
MQRNALAFPLSALFIAVSAVSSALAQTVDFEEFAHSDSQILTQPSPLVGAGFKFSADNNRALEFTITGEAHPNFMGSTGIQLPEATAIFVEREDGALFDFTGLDVGAWEDIQGTVEICGVKDNGTTVTETVTIDASANQQVWLSLSEDFSGVRKLRLPATLSIGTSATALALEIDNLQYSNIRASTESNTDTSGCDIDAKFNRVDRLEPPNQEHQSYFGVSAVAADGNLIAADYIDGEGSGNTVELYAPGPYGNFEHVGSIPVQVRAITIDGDLIALADDNYAVKLYRFNAVERRIDLVQEIVDPSGWPVDSIALNDDTLVVGISGESGQVKVFRADSPDRASFSLEQVITQSAGAEIPGFGFAVALNDSGELFVTHTPMFEDNPQQTRPVHIFNFDGTLWQETQQILQSDNGEPIPSFGSAIAATTDRVMIRGDNWSAYLFEKRNGIYTLNTVVPGLMYYSRIAITEAHAFYSFDHTDSMGNRHSYTGILDISELGSATPWETVQVVESGGRQLAASGDLLIVGGNYLPFGQAMGAVDIYRLEAISPNGQQDTDQDGMLDSWEQYYGLNPLHPADAPLDMDSDGLTNLQEFNLGTNPGSTDTDLDGIPDVDEVNMSLAPTDPNADSDGDGLSDAYEWQLQPTLWPNNANDASTVDRDNDGLSEIAEINAGTNPVLADTDSDGVSDGSEVALGISPLNPDSDNDNLPDGWELQYSFNAASAANRNQDPDADGYTNYQEFSTGTNPTEYNNRPPVANAGADRTVASKASVTLNGSASTDPYGSISSYRWTQTGGQSVTLTASNSVQASFKAPTVKGNQAITLTFQLTVTDAYGATNSDTVVVTVNR